MDLNGRFIPGAVIDFIHQASDDSDHPYFLCLDEMNLARVEYYMSDFLSIMETRDLKEGKIKTDPLITESYYGGDQEALEKYGKLTFPENLYVIGTVNMDETTFPFSRKVLDRANTIEFSKVNLTLADQEEEADGGEAEILEQDNSFLKARFLRLKQCLDQRDIVAEYCLRLETVNKMLEKAGAHVGYRVRDEIVFYLLNNREFGLMSEEVAFDHALMQKILPRIQGSSTSVKEMLCELFKYCARDYEGYQTKSDDIASKMDEALESDKGRYPRSAEKIAFMTRRLEEDGFTSYWL